MFENRGVLALRKQWSGRNTDKRYFARAFYDGLVHLPVIEEEHRRALAHPAQQDRPPRSVSKTILNMTLVPNHKIRSSPGHRYRIVTRS